MKILIAGFFVLSMILSSFLSVGAVSVDKEEKIITVQDNSIKIQTWHCMEGDHGMHTGKFSGVWVTLSNGIESHTKNSGVLGVCTFNNLKGPGPYTARWPAGLRMKSGEESGLELGGNYIVEVERAKSKTKNIDMLDLPIFSNIFRLLDLGFFNL